MADDGRVNIDQLKSKFESKETRRSVPPSKPAGSGSRPKSGSKPPIATKKPALPPRPHGKNVSKMGAALMKNRPGGVLTGQAGGSPSGAGRGAGEPKRTSMSPPHTASQEEPDSPGLAALAQVIHSSPTSPRRTPPTPPAKARTPSPHRSPQCTPPIPPTKPHSPSVSPDRSPRTGSPKDAHVPEKQGLQENWQDTGGATGTKVESTGSRNTDTSPPKRTASPKRVHDLLAGKERLGATGKARSVDVEPGGDREAGSPLPQRPFSISVSEVSDLIPMRRSSPVLGDRHRTKLRHSTGVSRSYENALDSPITIPRAETARPVSPLASSPQNKGNLSPNTCNKEPSERKPRGASVPHSAQLSTSPPPGHEGKKRSSSDAQPQGDNPTPSKYGPKPKVPRKPASWVNLSGNLSGRSSSSESVPDPQTLSRESSISPPGSGLQSPGLGPPAVVVRSETGTSLYRTGDSVSGKVHPGALPGTEKVEEEDEKQPKSPHSVQALSPVTTSRHSGAEMASGPAAGGSRGNIDSGFISEPPDDLVLGRKESVDSTMSEEKAAQGASDRSSGVWDEARVSE